ncbi:MAG: GNAT family N-acetyltransferase [Anaerolineales bacterium]
MTDMLVKLYDLPETLSTFSNLVPPDVTIRKPIGTEKSLAVNWVRENFEEGWATEMEVSFSRAPTSSYIAQHGRSMIGFACYDTAALGLFGPMGVLESYQGQGVGKALLLACLVEMKIKGYAYAAVGWAGPQEFYAKTAGAVAIPDSTPGIWKNWLGGSE